MTDDETAPREKRGWCLGAARRKSLQTETWMKVGHQIFPSLYYVYQRECPTLFLS